MSRGSPSSDAGRIAPLSVLPVFFKLRGKRAVVAGNGAGAAWKAELLAAAGAEVDIFADDPAQELVDVVAAVEAIRHVPRGWQPDDLAGAAIAIADVEHETEAEASVAAARAAGIPVNVVDKPSFCDFQFGGIVNRSPLVIGISTDGAAPVFGQAVRTRIETALPTGFQRWAEAARAWRPYVQALALPFQARRRVWEHFARVALARPNEPPTEADREVFVAQARREDAEGAGGSVVLVGAGPGDPELLTLKAVRALQSADVILHDDLVSDAILDYARREAKRMIVGKRGGRPSCKQDDINVTMVQLAKAGKRVVRLKGGDPMVFGRAGEEIAACRAAGIPVEVVPGITAALGAASRIETSLTHRDHARRLQFITAHARDGKLPKDLDWSAIADPAATTAIYMGKAVLAEFAGAAMSAGLAADTPVIIVENATRSDERVFQATVATMAERLAGETVEGPCVTLIGWALGEATIATALPDTPSRAAG